jgi:flagellar biosynthesis/type III secretory pathway chaperone
VFPEVLKRHRIAGELVARILESDRELLQQLQAAEEDRRQAAHAIETGEVTLNAYRRVLAPAVSSVGLINRRG